MAPGHGRVLETGWHNGLKVVWREVKEGDERGFGASRQRKLADYSV